MEEKRYNSVQVPLPCRRHNTGQRLPSRNTLSVSVKRQRHSDKTIKNNNELKNL